LVFHFPKFLSSLKPCSSQTQDRARLNYYQTKFDRGMILAATKGPIARLANHSCESNSEILKRLVEDQPQIVLFAGDCRSSTEEKLIDDYNFKWVPGSLLFSAQQPDVLLTPLRMFRNADMVKIIEMVPCAKDREI
jgi:hypothetical protein